MRIKLPISLSAMLLVAASVTSAQTLPRFQATVVGPASFSPSCFVTRISDSGIMAGQCDPFGKYAGGVAVWRNGVATSFGKLPKGQYAEARAMNSFGVATGDADLGDSRPHAFVTYKGALLQMKEGGVNDRAIGISDTGVIFGNVVKGFDGIWTPVFWAADAAKPDRYRMTPLPFFNDGGNPASYGAYLLASNKGGQAVGWIDGSVIGQWGGFWNNDVAHTVAPLAPLPNAYHAIALGLNDIGQAVGYSSTPSFAEHAVLWQNDAAHTIVDLGVLPGDAASNAGLINNAGQIVGTSANSSTPGSQYRVFFYQNGTMSDLTSLIDTSNGAWEIQSVMSLNNAGQMVAEGLHDGQLVHNIILTPIQ